MQGINYRFQKSGKSGIILTHGFGSNIDKKGITEAEKLFLSKGFSTISFDMFGHGKSDGKIEDLKLSDIFELFISINEIFSQNGIICKYVYGSSFSTLPTLKFGNYLNSVETIFLKTPVFNYKEKRLKELGKEKFEFWKKKGIIEIIPAFGDKSAIFQKYNFIEDFDDNFTNIFLENKKKLFLLAGKFDEEVSIIDLRKKSQKDEKIFLYEYEENHRFGENGTIKMLQDISSYIS